MLEIVKLVISVTILVCLFVAGINLTGCTHCVRCEHSLEQCRTDLIQEIDNQTRQEVDCLEIRNGVYGE